MSNDKPKVSEGELQWYTAKTNKNENENPVGGRLGFAEGRKGERGRAVLSFSSALPISPRIGHPPQAGHLHFFVDSTRLAFKTETLRALAKRGPTTPRGAAGNSIKPDELKPQ